MLGAAVLGAAILALTAFGVARLSRFVPSALLYHVVVFAAFWGVYQLLPGGFADNFNIPSNLRTQDKYRGAGPMDVAYYALVIHATVGFGDVYAITWQARAATMVHILLSFIGTANLLPISRLVT